MIDAFLNLAHLAQSAAKPNPIAAYVALAVSLISTAVTLYINRKAHANTLEIEAVKAQLQDKSGERDARRDYEYEARKRLYSDVEPLLFQLTEAVENAHRRITALAVNAREGALSDESTWLTVMTEYYATFTMHQLLLPAAIIRLVQEKLTYVDFGVDQKLYLQFRIGKQIYGLWRSDHDIRRAGRELEYKPHAENAKQPRLTNPEVYWKQGIPTGYLDIVTSALIHRNGESAPRVLTYEEFSRLLSSDPQPAAFHPLVDLFLRFHPNRRPVLWRILAGQAMLCKALLDLRDDADPQHFKVRVFSDEEILRRFDWSGSPDLPREVIIEPFRAAAAYLRDQLGSSMVETIRSDINDRVASAAPPRTS
jgi:hypothetical protein